MVRVLLDTLGANDVKVVVSTNEMLHMPAIRALQAPEPAWDEPRDMDSVGYGGGWGAQRTILFAGLRYAHEISGIRTNHSRMCVPSM